MRKPNTSPAVFQQRHHPVDGLDDFPTPPWATRAFVEHVLLRFAELSDRVLEPACNRGFMVRPLTEYFDVTASDIADYGWHGQQRVADFLTDDPLERPEQPERPDWVVTNPPFVKAAEFIHRSLDVARRGVAVIVRGAFSEGIDRYETLFSVRPPTVIAFHSERVSMVNGAYDPDANRPTQYVWMLWVHGIRPQPPVWIPPCKKVLMRTNDTIWQNPDGAFA